MTIDKTIMVMDKTSDIFEARITGTEENGETILNFYSATINLMNIEGRDFWDCLIKLRDIFEKDGMYLMIQASAKNVHHSGMSRDMSSGLKAYALQIGKKSNIAQVVDVFEPASKEIVGSIKDQLNFYENWLKTPKD